MKAFHLGALALALFFYAASARSEAPARSFNSWQFPGLVSTEIVRYDDAVLDFELDRRDGVALHFRRCSDVEATADDDVVESEFGLLALLRVNCAALKRYAASTPARRNHFSPRLTPAEVAAFPARATVRLSNGAPGRDDARTLGDLTPKPVVSITGRDSVKVETAQDMLVYHVMARADFDGDAVQDLLVRIDWHARDAMGRGSGLAILSRTTAGGPITSIWNQ